MCFLSLFLITDHEGLIILILFISSYFAYLPHYLTLLFHLAKPDGQHCICQFLYRALCIRNKQKEKTSLPTHSSALEPGKWTYRITVITYLGCAICQVLYIEKSCEVDIFTFSHFILGNFSLQSSKSLRAIQHSNLVYLNLETKIEPVQPLNVVFVPNLCQKLSDFVYENVKRRGILIFITHTHTSIPWNCFLFNFLSKTVNRELL